MKTLKVSLANYNELQAGYFFKSGMGFAEETFRVSYLLSLRKRGVKVAINSAGEAPLWVKSPPIITGKSIQYEETV